MKKTDKQQCYFCTSNVGIIDYKDVETLKRFLHPQERILAKRHTSVCSKHQRKLAQAIKRARFMALLPFTPQ